MKRLISCLVMAFGNFAPVRGQHVTLLNCEEKNGMRDTVFVFNPYSAGTVYRIPDSSIPADAQIGMPYNAKLPAEDVVSFDTVLLYAAEKCDVLGVEAYERMVLPTVKGLYTYMRKNLRYPESLQSKKKHGYVPVAFTIKAHGSAQNVRVLRSLHPLLDAEAVRLVTNIPADYWMVPAPREYKSMIFWGTYQCRMLIKF